MGEQNTEKKRDPVLRVLLSLGRGLLLVGLFLYLLYHLTGGFAVEMRTETVLLSTEELLLTGEGTVVRDERVVRTGLGGVVGYRYTDGTRVPVGAKIAVVYSGADSATVAEIAEIDRAIDLLSAAEIREDTGISDGTAADHRLHDRARLLSEQLSRGEYADAAESADVALTLLLQRDTILAGGDAAGKRLADLRAERERLAVRLGGSDAVYAPEAGYFYSETDGGEEAFAFDRVLSLTPAEYRLKLSAFGAPASDSIGKMVRRSKWYFLLPVSEEEAIGLAIGKNYELLLGVNETRVSMHLDAKNEGDGETLLILSALGMPDGFSFDRMQRASLVRDTVSGYRIPASALRVVEDTVGVYIRSGNTVRFRTADVLYESGAYVYIDPKTEGVTLYADDTDAENDLYCAPLSLYDAVIVSGARDLIPEGIVK